MSTTDLAHPHAPAPTGLVDVQGRPFPLQRTRLRSHAEGGIARTTLEQSYTNPYDETLEVLYTMPLPADGAVIGYTIHLGEKRITGHIEGREEARASYQKALEEGRTAGLLEQERADTFTQSLGSLPARAEVRVEIEVLQPLAFRAATAGDGGLWEYRFPTVVGVRYEGGPGRVPDAGRLDVERANEHGTPARLELDVLLADGDPTEVAPRSASHEITIAELPAGEGTRVALAAPAALDRDVVLQWRATCDEIGVRLLEGRGLAGDEGRYGLLTITPPSLPDTAFARDLTVLIDASGSMNGAPLERAKEIVIALLGSLRPADRFEILSFASSVERFGKKPAAATEANVASAIALVGKLRAGGATEMTGALREALKPLRKDSQRQVVLLTDGYIGFENEVIGHVLQKMPEGARLHTVGIGAAPNRTLTRGAARAGRGVELIVGEDAGIGEAAERLLRATVGPVLTDLSIGGSAMRETVPMRPRDLLEGQPLVVAVELDTTAGLLEVSGRLAGSRSGWSARVAVGDVSDVRDGVPAEKLDGAGADAPRGRSTEAAPVVGSGTRSRFSSLPIGALFGREAIEDQEMLLAAAMEREGHGIIARIRELGLRHQIASRETSLVAIADVPTVDPSEPRRRERLPVELPAEVSAAGVGLVGMPTVHVCASFAGGTGASPSTETQFLASPSKMRGQPPEGLFDRSLSEDELAAPRSPAARKARGIIQRGLDRLFGGEPTEREMLRVRCTRVEGNLLVIEFETPADGFDLPDSTTPLRVRLDDGREIEARVVTDRSTRPGRHVAGRTVRLALRLADGSDWPRGRAVLDWAGAEREQATTPLPTVILVVELQAER